MKSFQFHYQEFASDTDLPAEYQGLLRQARQITANAYAPYSNFFVGAAVQLEDGTIVSGVNIENASYPVGICAERSALASAISQYPEKQIVAIAISYASERSKSNKPAFPCGLCRQFISECEDRNGQPITLLLSGQEGVVVVIHSAKHLLPFSFTGSDLG